MLVKALDRAKTRNEASLKSTSWRGAPTCLNMERAVKCSSAAIATLREVMRSSQVPSGRYRSTQQSTYPLPAALSPCLSHSSHTQNTPCELRVTCELCVRVICVCLRE